MPNKVTYTITTSDGKEHQVSKENVDKYGIQSYADAYKGATIRMRDAQKGDYDIPLQHFDNARKQGLHAFSLEHTPVQKQAAPKPTPTPTAKPTPSPSVHPRQSTPQGSKPLLSDSFGKGTGTDFLKPKPVGYNLSEEHRNEVLGEQAKRSATPSNPHVQRAVQLGNEAKTKRVEREQKRFGKPTIAKAFDDAVHGDKNAAKELGMPQVMQQKKDEIDYMQATGKELRNPVDAGLTYDENGDIVHSMFAPTVARDEHGNIVTNDAGEPLVGVSSDEARAKAYGDSVQTGIEAQREKDKVDNLYKDAVGSVSDAFDEDYKKKEAFRKEHPFLGAVSDALEGFSNRGNALQYTPEGAKPGLAALGMMTKAAQMKENADRYGDAGTLSRLYGGIMAGLTDVDTYDFGITDTFNAANLYRAAKNYEEGKATAKDKMLLDAAAIANNVQSEASDKLGGAFGAGQNLVGTIGFMAQMATNPASGVGKEAAASVAKTVAKRALQKFGKGAIAKAVTGLAKGATRVGMDAVEAGVVTGMYSPTKIVGDYLNRKTGDVQSDGKGGYIFQNKEYSDVKALAKAINGQYAENISEMWGEYLPGVGKVNAAIGRGARKIGLGKVVDAFEHMSSSNWAKTWKNFQERTKWNGMAGEYFEEVANNLYNAVTNGDMTLDTDPHTGVFNPKINLDTFYSVALMSGIMSGVNTAGYARERYKAPHEQHKADAQARSVFGERWDEYKNAIDNADEKQIGSVMEKIGSDKSLSSAQKIAALQYQYRTAVVHGVNAQDTKNKLEGQFNAMDEAYSMGYNLQDEKELNNTAILYDEAKKQATKATGWGEDTLESMIGEDGGASTLAYMKRSDEFNDGQLQAFTDYANARAAYNGMIQRVKDDIDTKVHESELEVDQRTNLDTGAIHPATMKVDDRQVYIVNGNVVMLPDGSGVDHEHSDDFVVLRDAETGELETADPSAIFKVDAPINVQEEKEAAADNIRQTFAQQQADKIDGKLEFKQGDTYSIIDKEDGAQHSLSIIGDAIDEKTGQVNPEMVLVDIDGAQQPILLPKEQVQQQVDEARRAAVAATQVVENAPTTNTNNTYSINDEVTLSDENGNAVRGSITAPENEDGKFEVYTEQPINGKKVNLFSAEELDAITKAPETVAENATVQQPQQQEETEESVEKEPPKQQPTALERIPKDESGQPLYEQTEPETAWDAIVEQTEGDTSMAQNVADDMVSDLEASVKKAEKTKAKSGGSIAEKIAAEKERAAVIEQAKATLAHWRKIAAVNRMREAAIQAEEQRKANEVARVRKEQEEKERVEQEEAERIKREALNGVPDFVEDKATDARARGYRRVNGDKVDRQEPIDATKGKEVQVKFDDDNIPTGHVAIIEANQLQPSHKNGQRNPQHFIDEAQPKERKDDASVGAARKIAANIRPEEITSSVTAYTGAPTVNSRGEVIQGNNRSAALREMWDNHQEQGDKYKQYLIDNAESFGLRAEDIAAMDKPVLVNMLDVNDDEAISLGQFVASDTESGGTERIKPKNVVKKLGDKMKNFANILLRANDENISFAELVDSNGVDALKWLNANGVISPTQYKSAFDSKGNITAEAKNDIKGIMFQSIFEGGNTQLEEMFNALPAKAQKAILATAYRDYDSPQSERMIGDIQDSIMAYYALSHDSMFMNAKNHKDARIAVEAWRRQLAFDDVTGESYLPAEKYSNFALLLATMYKGDNQSLIQGTFNKMYDLIQGTQEETLFEQPDNTPRSLAQAIKETLNIEYNGQQGSNVLAGDNSASQEGRTGSNGDATPRGRSENIDGAEANQGGTEGDSGRSGSGQSSGGSQEEVAAENSHLTKKEAADFIAQMELGADVAQEIPLTIENWDKEFGEDGIVSTPIGDVKMGENQFAKLMRAGRNGKLGMLKPTLEYPDAIVEENSKAKEGTHTERPSSFIFIKSFRKTDGTRYYYFTSITVSVDGKEVVVSNQEKSRNRILRLLMEGSVIWRTPKDATTSSAEKQGLDYVHPDKAEGETKGSVITPQNTPSVGKDKQSSATKQEIVDNYLEKPASSEDLFAKAERVAEEDKAKRTRKKEEAKVDTNPTEAQKEAGNYKKGHIKVDSFNVTIEQPKGSVRRGKDANGKEWETEMHNTYGYIRGTESVDGDHIDIFLSDNPTEGNVFVVDQVNKDGSFDEHKVMYGFSDMESARKAYLSNYEEGWQGLGNITEVSKEEFKKWIDSSKRKTKPFAEYSTVKTQGDVQTKKPTETEDFARQDLKELEDFQKNTDTTGRTTIDVDRYEAEDLFAPLLLDGKTSRLGVLTVVPDKITDPSGQIAVYDYSDEIDEKTNSGWQKWGDLTDEYNKTVDSSDKAQERGDTATLGFTSVDAALKFYDWLNTGGHEYQENGSLQYSTEDLTNNTTAKRLVTDTILSALNKAGIEVVRATDEQAQELLANTHATSLHTPQGTIYGWAVDGKIYLTEAGINPDTPIHEYTHLWAEAMMTKNKKGWNSIKALLKETPVWNEVVADPNYSNIMNDEDAVASEVLSRISGRENAARMESEAQKVIDEDKDVFEKAKSVTLLNRIKRALDMFWKWVGKELFKIKKFGSINEVTDRVLYDLMHSTKLNSNDKSLIGVHNISEQKLRKVLKQGGFANPSIAVIDTDKQVHNDYGEISLILPSRKINKSTGKNAGTFEGDAWTPMYPVVEKQISSDGGITMHNDINAVPKDMQSKVRNALNGWLENGSDTDLSYLYLFQQGKAPQMIVEKPKYSNEVYKTLNDIMFGVNSVYNLSKNEIKKLVELYIQTELDGNIKEYNEAIQRKISKYEELIKRGKPNSLQYRVADSYLEDIEKYGYPLSPLINFVNDVQRDKIKQGSKNAQKTLNTASQIIKDAGLEKDFKNWVEGLNNRYQTKEVIFDGFTPTGKRRYIPNTLENVSKIMKKQGRQASAGISISFSNFAAAVMKANGSLDNIRKKKSKLTNEHKDIEDFEEKWKEVYFDLAMKLQPNANMFDDYGFARLQEAANEKNPQTYIRNVYGITLSEEDVQKLQDLVEAIREERPALYFETKFERPVILNEFSKAVVPEDLSDDLKKTLRDNGVEVFTYKRGDIEERQKATQEAAYSSNDIAFQVIDNSRDSELIAINEQFNRELAELTEENAQSKRLKLGYPSPMLSAAGVPDKPIILYGNKLLKKSKLHNFDVKELHNLPLAMQNPIAVFEGSHPNSFATLLEIKLGGHNTLASIEVNKKGEADFNFISSLFGKESKGVTKWILDGKLLSVDKEKAQSYISASALNADATYKNELSSAAKIVKDFVNPNIDEEKLREGYGSYNNTELSFINDPVAKMLGKSNRTEEDHKAFAERERQRMISRINELADKLHLDNIETVTDSNSLQGKKAKAKGFYSKSSGKITIVIPNHASVEDAEKTLLHEAVAHYGLRKLFGEHFETFLDNVYQNVEPEIRRIITSQAANNNWDFRTATEEYLAGLAERTDFERVHYAIWNKIKSLFLKMLHSIGFEGWSATELSDNELRYLLWRSYENMKEPGRYRSILGEAEDIAKQNELKVGNYDQQDTNSSNVAESKTETENTLYRQGSNGQSPYDIYENAVKDSGTQTMLGALARTVFSKDARTRFKNKFAESYFDYSRSIKQLQDAIEESLGVKLDSYEDVWRTLNAKGSADAQEVNLAMLRYIAPLAEHIGYMIKGKSLNGEALTVDDVEKYMNAVHGIERNKHMQEAAFRDKLIKKLKSEGYSNDESEAIVEAELDNIRKGNGSMYMDIYDNVRKDYSGLTALFGDEVEDVDNIDELEAAATQYANDFGKTVGMDKTLELWDKVRALNDFSLRKSYLSGLISKAQYEGVKQMFQYYVPLRGWHEGAAGDIYEYISRGERAGMLESALKVAKGRKSRAGDILGTMAAMANTAIVQGNRNLVAQKFLNMALNYGEKSGLLMVGKQWYEESANEELIPLFPNLHDGMTVQEQQDEIERFEKDMEEKRKAGRVRELRKGFNKEVGLRMPKWQEQEHCVRVLRNGREHQVYVLGNPRAAQAFNGLLNKQAKSDILRDGWTAWMRAKATMQTSLSPEFVFSNFQRDILTAGTGTYIKFGRKAGVEFAKNLTMLNPMAGMSEGRAGGIFTLIHRYNKGTLDMSNEVERMFDEFVRNGGMTGVSVIEGKDEYQKSINKAVKRIKQGKLDMGRQAIHGLADAIEFMNSGVENSTRFAAYMVSRKTLGKSVTESVFDAKEASVNFNMKGSGAWLNLWMRRNIMYANPAIQSLRMLGTWYDASPKRFMGVLSTIIATSVTMAMLWASVGAGDGDDDNDWYKLSEWNRYNYLNVWTGNGYAHWSLPQEFRPVWALGQIVFDWQRGMVSKERAINSMMTQLNNLSPMAFFSGGMDSKDSYWKTAIRAWTPTIAADFSDAYVWNENFLGQKITNQEDYNIDSPEFQRAGKNTPHWAVSLSKQWNNGTGGAENRKSYWDSSAINPSALYYLAQQQLGGLGTMVTKLSKAYEQLEDPNGELEAKNIPFVSKVWVSTEDKQSKNRVTDDKFWMIYNDWKLIDSEMKHNKSDVEKGKMSLTDLAERMNELQQNGDHKRWARLRGYMKGYDELRKARNNGADVEEAMDELKKDVVKEEEKTLTNK